MMLHALTPMLRTSFAAVVAAALLAAPSWAEEYPSKRITLVAPAWAGTMADALARIVAERLSAKDRLGRPVVVEDRPGARAFLGYDRVAEAAPDGYTLLLASQQVSLPREMTPSERFDPANFTPLGRLASAPFIVAVSTRIPVRTLQELVAHARAHPDTLNYGVLSNSTMQLDMLQFGELLRAPLTEVPFRRSASILTSLLGNHVQLSFVTDLAVPFVRTGRLRALAVTSRARWSRLPEVPAMKELGFDFEAAYWYGIAVHAATPDPIQHRLVRELSEIMGLREVRDLIARLGMDPLEPSPAEMAQHMQRERAQAESAFKLLKARAAVPADLPRGGRSPERRNGTRDILGGA
jgi:tripartite-type tricarboxylate transporter receptor subunit TctC